MSGVYDYVMFAMGIASSRIIYPILHVKLNFSYINLVVHFNQYKLFSNLNAKCLNLLL